MFLMEVKSRGQTSRLLAMGAALALGRKGLSMFTQKALEDLRGARPLHEPVWVQDYAVDGVNAALARQKNPEDLKKTRPGLFFGSYMASPAIILVDVKRMGEIVV
jgi:hypothetical protein